MGLVNQFLITCNLAAYLAAGSGAPIDFQFSDEHGVTVAAGIEGYRMVGSALRFSLSAEAHRTLGRPPTITCDLADLSSERLLELGRSIHGILPIADA